MGFDNPITNTKSKIKTEIVAKLSFSNKIHNALKDIKAKKLSKEDIEEIRIDSYSYTY